MKTKSINRSEVSASKSKIDEDKLLQQQMLENQIKNFKIGNSEVRMIGDKIVLVQIIKLLAYIRNAIQSNTKTTISVKVGQRIANAQFTFYVNQLPIDDLIAQDEVVVS